MIDASSAQEIAVGQDYPSQTPETTQWAQKHFDPGYECLDPVSSVGEPPMV